MIFHLLKERWIYIPSYESTELNLHLLLSECWDINKIFFVKYSALLMLLLLPSWRSLDQLIPIKLDFIL